MPKKPKEPDPNKIALKGQSNPIPLEELLEYRQRGWSIQEIATQVGCSRQNVSDRLQRANIDGLQMYSKHKASVFEAKQKQILDSITEDKIANMSAAQAVVGAAIFEDKIRLIRGQATEIIDIRQISIDLETITKRMQDELSKGEVIDC